MQEHEELYGRMPLGYGGRFYGVYTAQVTAINDPDGQGRIQVLLPWSPDPQGSGDFTVWARLATVFAGLNRGSWFLPDLSDEVLVCFEGGDPRRPVVLGGLWNGVDTPPETMDEDQKNYIKSLTSRQGVKLTMDDTEQKERFEAVTPQQQRLTFQDDESSPTVTLADKDLDTVTMSVGTIKIFNKENKSQLTLAEDATTLKTNDSVLLDGNSTVTVKDGGSDKITLSGGNIKVEAPTGVTIQVGSNSIKVSQTGAVITVGANTINVSQTAITATVGVNSINVSQSGITASSGPNSVNIGPASVTTTVGPNTATVSMGGITLAAAGGAGTVNIGPSGVTVMGPTISFQAGSVSVTAGQFAVTAGIVNLTTAMVQTPGVLQASCIIAAGSVASPTYTPGGGNML